MRKLPKNNKMLVLDARSLSRPIALIAVLILISYTTLKAQTLKVWPGTAKGSGITYGADVKLTLWRISNYNAVNQKFKDMGFDQVRVPIVAHWGSTDSRYNDVKDFVVSAKSKGLNVFASVANCDGTFKPNGDLNDAHNGHKFPDWMKCTSAGGTLSCTSSETGLYGVKLPKYKTYLQTVVNDKITNVSWVGPWNEDDAGASDYSGLDWGKSMVGVESWGLSTADTKMSQVGSSIDVGGAHNYVSNNAVPNLDAAYDEWEDFIDNGGDWFTESTLYAKSTAHGIAHMLPAISAGIKKIVIYQAVTRLVTTSGGNGTHYAATNHLMKNSKGKGSARRMETNNTNYVGAAFSSGGKLVLHLCNINSSSKTIWVNLQQGYTVTSVAGKTTYGGSSTVTVKNSGAQVEVTLPGESYARISLNGLSNSGNRVGELIDELTSNAESQFSIYPNPASSGSISITLPITDDTHAPVRVLLVNMEGRMIKEETFLDSEDITFNYGNAKKGIYFLDVQQGDFERTQRILIQ